MNVAYRMAFGVCLVAVIGWLMFADATFLASVALGPQTVWILLGLTMAAFFGYGLLGHHGKRTRDDVRCRLRIFEFVPVPMVVVDGALRIVGMNAAARDFYGLQENAAVGREALVLWPETERQDAVARLGSALLTGGRFEAKQVTSGGSVKLALIVADRWKASDGPMLQLFVQALSEECAEKDADGIRLSGGDDGMLGGTLRENPPMPCQLAADAPSSGLWKTDVSRDIASESGTSYDANEQRRKSSADTRAGTDALFRLLADHAPLAIILGTDERFTYRNLAARNLLEGTSSDTLIGRNVLDSVHPCDQKKMRDLMRSAQHDKQLCRMNGIQWMRRDGASLVCDVSAIPIHEGGVESVAVFLCDVSEAWRARSRSSQRRQLEVVQRLAGGLAHCLDSQLQVINGESERACVELGNNGHVRDLLGKIRHAARNASALVDRLKVLGRRHLMSVGRFDLNEVVDGAVHRFDRQIGPEIQIDCLYAKEPLPLKGDSSALEELFVNLVTYACDAMPNRGVLTIATENVFLDESFCAQNLWATPGHYAVLHVKDTGRGISKEAIEHLFEPFSSEEKAGGCAGLGLALVNSIVTQHDGFIHAESAQENGTAFQVYLPLVQPIDEPSAEQKKAQGAPGGRGTVLLAEDEAMVRAVVSRLLRNAGYRVLEACDGQEAVELFQMHKKNVRGVILDVIMPRLDGFKAHDQIKSLSPDIPVIFASAFSPQQLNGQFALIDGVNLVQKPFNSSVLLNVLEKSLGDRRNDGGV